jgi:hypothetical protein
MSDNISNEDMYAIPLTQITDVAITAVACTLGAIPPQVAVISLQPAPALDAVNRVDAVSISAVPAVPPAKQKCSMHGCPGLPISVHQPLVSCDNGLCNQKAHCPCYQHMISKRKKHYHVRDLDIFCTIESQKMFEKTANGFSSTWKNDGSLGPDDPQHSEYWIIQWLNTNSNFRKWQAPSQGQLRARLLKGLLHGSTPEESGAPSLPHRSLKVSCT